MKLMLLAMATLGMMATHVCGYAAPTTATKDAEKGHAVPADRGRNQPGRPLNEEPQPGPTPSVAPPGYVLATAADGRGGATSYTETMPLDGRSLAQMRKWQLPRPELRGAWITRFDWARRPHDVEDETSPTSTRDALTSRIKSLMEEAKSLNLNAVFFQVRGDATTLYPSNLEPWSQRFGGKDPGFDPVKFAIDEAHKQGLEFHAYLNPIPCSEETTTPANPNHIWYKHCMPDSKPNWLVFENGAPAPRFEYFWFNPNLPEVQVYIRTVIMDFVRRYDVDGVHYDRIRFPSHKVSDDPWSKERYDTGKKGANPMDLPYNSWQADNITRLLTDLYGSVMEIKPKLKVSASVWGIYDNTKLPQGEDKASGYSWTSSGLQNFLQDSIAWVNTGCMDAIVPMIYWNMGDLKPDYDELLLSFMTQVKTGRHVYGGQRVFTKEEMLREVLATNLIGAQGNVAFTLGRISRMADYYRKNIYPVPAPVPEMWWKKSTAFGTVLVNVEGPDGKPVTDAQVRVDNHKMVGLTSADGFCALLNVDTGKVSLRCNKPDVGIYETYINVEGGKVLRISAHLGR